MRLADATKDAIEAEVRMLLHASRDCLRNQGQDTSKLTFRIHDAYYAEAFGVLRTLIVLGYYKAFGAVTDSTSLAFWRHTIEQKVLAEENYGGSNQCDYCLEHYGRDGAGRRRT